MDDIEDLTEALLEHKTEIFRPHGNQDLVLTPDIDRDVDWPYSICRDTRTGSRRVAEGLYEQRYMLILKRFDGLRVNYLRAGIGQFDRVLITQRGDELGVGLDTRIGVEDTRYIFPDGDRFGIEVVA